MARAYQESHVIDSLNSSVKALQSQSAELFKAKGHNEEKITKLERQNAEQAKKIDALELRMKANEHNTAARIQNLTLYTSHSLHTPLTPLHDLSTNQPIRKFPKHERDVRTMGNTDVIMVLQALEVKHLGMGMAEKKGEVRVQVGLPRDVEKLEAAGGAKVIEIATGAGGKAVDGVAATPGATKGKKEVPKVAPGSTAEKMGKAGTASAKGVSTPANEGKKS